MWYSKAYREARQAGGGEQALRHLLRAAAPHVGNHAVVLVGGEVGLQPLNELVAHLQQALYSAAAVGPVGLPASLQRDYRALSELATCLQRSSSECSPKLWPHPATHLALQQRAAVGHQRALAVHDGAAL